MKIFIIFWCIYTPLNFRIWDNISSTISNYTIWYEIPEDIFYTFKNKKFKWSITDSKLSSRNSGYISPKSGRDLEKRTGSKRTEEEWKKFRHFDPGDESDNRSVHSDVSDFWSWIFAFKKYLKTEFEALLRNNKNESRSSNQLEITNVHLLFNHCELYEMLEERGEAIKDSENEVQKKIESDIIDYISEHKEEISIPKEAYITFETEEGYRIASEIQSVKWCGLEKSNHLWKDRRIMFEKAKEPSNIEFENKFQSSWHLFLKKVIVLIALFLYLTFVCYLIYLFMYNVNRLNRIFPQIDWDEVLSESNQEMLKNYAMIEWYNYDQSDKSDKAMIEINTDNLQCFWDDLRDQTSYFEALEMKFDITVFNHKVIGNVWRDYLRSSIFLELIDYLMPLIIIIGDIFLEAFANLCIRWIKYDNKTVEISKIQSAVFVLTFFNNGLTILLINANFGFVSQYHFLFNGVFTDFSDDWYDQISEFLVSPMFMEIINPITIFLFWYFIQKALALIDRRFTDQKLYRTQCKLVYDYADLYSGTENELSDKYPQMLTISFLAIFYGFGLPLIPITVLIVLVVTYIFDKITAMLYHRKPPLYDNSLNKAWIFFLRWGVFCYAAIAYWMLTNKQMFDNVIDPITCKDDIEDYHHYPNEIPKKPQQVFLLIFTIGLFIVLFMHNFVVYVVCDIFETTDVEYTKEIEGLTSFSLSLQQKDMCLIAKEDKHRREHHAYKVLFDSFYNKISKRYNTIEYMQKNGSK